MINLGAREMRPEIRREQKSKDLVLQQHFVKTILGNRLLVLRLGKDGGKLFSQDQDGLRESVREHDEREREKVCEKKSDREGERVCERKRKKERERERAREMRNVKKRKERTFFF